MFVVGAMMTLTVGLAISALIFRAACWLIGVKSPSFVNALVATTAALVVSALVAFFIRVGLNAATVSLRQSQPLPNPIWPLLSLAITFPISMVLAAVIYAKLLKDVTFTQGILLWLAQLVLTALAVVVLFAVLFATRMALKNQSLFGMSDLDGWIA